ncbi:MAG TPA: ROK family protein [Acidimicrobiales bacterium]|nr:ROK family protein [Acidimicrobiales bacterium]
MARSGSIGIDVGGTKCLGVAIDESGSVVAEHRVATPEGGEAVLEAVAGVARALGCGTDVPIGVGMPGLVTADGVLAFAANLAGVADLPVRALLEEHLGGVRVTVDNDANCAAWAEHRLGAARGYDDVVMATLGTGIGGGIVVGGRLVRGAHGFGGEMGHMVVDPAGPECPCGNRGCWERFASGDAFGRMGREAAVGGRAPHLVELAGGDPHAVQGHHVGLAAAGGDEVSLELVGRFAWWLALGLANLANLLDPERFVIGGGVVEMGDLLLVPARSAFGRLLQGAGHRPEVPIVAAVMGEHAGAVGAALLGAAAR